MGAALVRPVFVHVNKNAGTSIVRAAGDQIVNAGHRTAASWIARNGRDAPLFAVVRHPYDRVRSEYGYRRRRWASGERNPHLANLALPLEDWIVATYEGDQYRTREFFERTGIGFNEGNMIGDVLIWFVPQTRWLCDADGELLVDELLRFERLAEDWAAFCERHGIEAELAHENASRTGSPASPATDPGAELSARARSVIADYYRVDFETFAFPE